MSRPESTTKTLLFALALLPLLGCEFGFEHVKHPKMETHVYTSDDPETGESIPTGFMIRGGRCDTGARLFETKAEFCEALRNQEEPHCAEVALRMRADRACDEEALVWRAEQPPGWSIFFNPADGETELGEPTGYGVRTPTCTLEFKELGSRKAFCTHLRDEALNEGCGPDQREEMWARECNEA